MGSPSDVRGEGRSRSPTSYSPGCAQISAREALPTRGNLLRHTCRARVPVEHRTPRSKPEIALAEIDRVMAERALWVCAGGCGIRAQRAVSTRANGTRAGLGRWHPASPQGVSGGCAAHLADYQSPREATKAPRTRYLVDRGRTHAGERQVENRELAQRNEGSAESPICCSACPHCRRPSAADMG
jgi:hypothetical protein